MTSDYLTIHEAAEILGITPDGVYYVCRRGSLDGVKMMTPRGLRWRVSRKAIAQYAKAREPVPSNIVTAKWCEECGRFHRADKEADVCTHCGRHNDDYNLVEMPEEYLSE